ncbi:MAG: DnaA/Hda family protein [Magnetococcus sp. YQC-5]
MMPLQHILEFGVDPIFTFDNYIVGESNRLAWQAVHMLMESEATSLTLTGDAGCGKTHLLHAAVTARWEQQGKESAVFLDPETLGAALAGGGEGELTRFLERWGDGVLVAVDNLEHLEHDPLSLQEGILFLFNRLRETGGRLLVGSRVSPQHLEWLRPDLRSRLLWGPVMVIAPPDDGELEAILTKMATDRQVRLSPELVKFLCLRLPRRIPDYASALARLDRAGLEQQRPLTVPLAKEALGL